QTIGGSTVVRGFIAEITIAGREPVILSDLVIHLAQCERDVLPKGDGVAKRSGQVESGYGGGGNGHGDWQVALDVLPGAEEEQLVFLDGTARVEVLIIHVLLGSGSGRRECSGASRKRGAAENVSGL